MNIEREAAIVSVIGVLLGMGAVLLDISGPQGRELAAPENVHAEDEKKISDGASQSDPLREVELLLELLESEQSRAQKRQVSGWLTLPPQVSLSDVTTTSALPIVGDRVPDTDDEFEQLREHLGYDVRHLRRTFAVEKRRFLLGEPILVRFAIELDGDGAWRIDDWWYYNNRDETFIMLLRDAEGKWVSDRYHPRDFYFGGGSILVEPFSRDKAEIHWVPIQQYCAITEPGEYELFCIKRNTNCARRNGFPSSPVLETIPEDVIAQATKHPFADVNFVTDYAQISITIDRGSEVERGTMIQTWADFVAESMPPSCHRGKTHAAVRAWEHCLQNDFLPSLYSYFEFYGYEPLALIYLADEYDRWEVKELTRMDVAELIPQMIDNLTAPDALARSTAEFHLRQWTEVAVEHNWQGHRSDRPTLEEAVALKEQWLNWWEENEAAFSLNDAQQ